MRKLAYVIRRVEAGEMMCAVVRLYSVIESTMHTIDEKQGCY